MFADIFELGLTAWEEKLVSAVFLSEKHSFDVLDKLVERERYLELLKALDLLKNIDWLTAREIAISSLMQSGHLNRERTP